jgi:hypothetical protein
MADFTGSQRKLKDVLNARMQNNKADEEAAEGDAEEEDNTQTWDKRVVQMAIEEAATPEEKAIVLELNKYV